MSCRELRRGLRETGRYLLSHHEPGERDRCHAVWLPGRDRPVRLCARCAGVYPGIALGVAAAATAPVPTLPLVALLPAPALADWATTALAGRRGSNAVRTLTGVALGAGYGVGLVALTRPPLRPPVVAVGVAYALLAGALLALDR